VQNIKLLGVLVAEFTGAEEIETVELATPLQPPAVVPLT
jgi:hypothetical protein